MILNKLAASLSPIVNGMLALLAFVQQQQLVLALLAGLTMPFFASMKSDERQKAPLWKKLIIAFSCCVFSPAHWLRSLSDPFSGCIRSDPAVIIRYWLGQYGLHSL